MHEINTHYMNSFLTYLKDSKYFFWLTN